MKRNPMPHYNAANARSALVTMKMRVERLRVVAVKSKQASDVLVEALDVASAGMTHALLEIERIYEQKVA